MFYFLYIYIYIFFFSNKFRISTSFCPSLCCGMTCFFFSLMVMSVASTSLFFNIFFVFPVFYYSWMFFPIVPMSSFMSKSYFLFLFLFSFQLICPCSFPSFLFLVFHCAYSVLRNIHSYENFFFLNFFPRFHSFSIFLLFSPFFCSVPFSLLP